MVPSEWGHPKRGDGWRVRPADPPKSTGSSETLVSCRAEPGQGLVLKPQRVVPHQEACFQLAGSEQAGLTTSSRELQAEGADDVRFVLVRYRCDRGDLRTNRLVAISGRILVMLGGEKEPWVPSVVLHTT